MSTDEYLFFDPGAMPPMQAAAAIADVLSADFPVGGAPRFVMPVIDVPGLELVGWLEENDYIADDPDPSAPEDRSAFDPFPLLFSMNVIPKDTVDRQQRAAFEAFRRVARSELRWPLVLVHNFELLIATYDVERGVREFPPGTRSDGTDEHLWR